MNLSAWLAAARDNSGWAGAIGLIVLGLKALFPYRKAALERTEGEVQRLTRRVAELEARLEEVTERMDAQREMYERHLDERSHELANERHAFDWMLDTLEFAPGRCAEVMPKVRAMRAEARQRTAEKFGPRAADPAPAAAAPKPRTRRKAAPRT